MEKRAVVRDSIPFILILSLTFLLMSTSFAVPPGYDLPRPEPGAAEQQAEDQNGQGFALNVGEDGEVFVICQLDMHQYGDFGGSDCWGWQAPDGREYAIMGVFDGLLIYNVTDGLVADNVPGPTFSCGTVRWRDMVTYQHYLYCVSECSGTNEGMMIVDLQYLPDSTHLVGSYFTESDVTSHNMAIDTARGYAYIVKSNYTGFRIVDLSDPENPVDINEVGTGNIHDMFARNDTVWVAEGTRSSFSIWDVSNKALPVELADVTIPSGGYSHNIWPSGDGRHVVTTEETPDHTVKIWNVEDPSNIQLDGEYLGPSGLAHNAHYVGDTIFLSHYESGVVAVDASDPFNPVELFQFDTYPSSENSDFNGAWGVFPHTASGKVYASNLDGRLFILDTRTVLLTSSLMGDSVVTVAGRRVRVDINFDNPFPVRRFDIPFTWPGDLGLRFDSISTEGLRTDYFKQRQWLVYDPAHARMAVRFGASTDDSEPDLPPGSGPVLSLHFFVPFSASGSPNPIVLSGTGSVEVRVQTDCFSYMPDVDTGWVALYDPLACCVSPVGNVDDSPGDVVDIGDLTALIDYLYISRVVPSCFPEANIDGSIDGIVDIGDLTALVSYLYLQSGFALPACP
jgi:choice-of-anchor B domain-containing protein